MTRIARTCSECSAHFETYPAWVRKGGGLTCSVDCGFVRRKRVAAERAAERFMRYVQPEPNSGCWFWLGPVLWQRGGYGVFSCVDIVSRSRFAHRVSYQIHRGYVPDGVFVCHQCDNPLCVNPDHLFLGTAADNNADKVRKGRVLRGEQIGNSKLTSSDVLAIRNDARSNARIAADYGVSTAHVQSIKAGKVWKRLEGVIT